MGYAKFLALIGNSECFWVNAAVSGVLPVEVFPLQNSFSAYHFTVDLSLFLVLFFPFEFMVPSGRNQNQTTVVQG